MPRFGVIHLEGITMKQYPFTQFMIQYLDGNASLPQQIQFEKWIERESKRSHRFNSMVRTYKLFTTLFPSLKMSLSRVNQSRIARGLPRI